MTLLSLAVCFDRSHSPINKPILRTEANPVLIAVGVS